MNHLLLPSTEFTGSGRRMISSDARDDAENSMEFVKRAFKNAIFLNFLAVLRHQPRQAMFQNGKLVMLSERG